MYAARGIYKFKCSRNFFVLRVNQSQGQAGQKLKIKSYVETMRDPSALFPFSGDCKQSFSETEQYSAAN